MSQKERCPFLEGECRREIESLETVLPRGWLENCADCNKFWTCEERKELLKKSLLKPGPDGRLADGLL